MTQLTEEKVVEKSASAVSRSLPRTVTLIASCTGAMIVNTATNTSTAIALPSVGQDLRISPDQLQWLVSGFALSSGCLLLFFGRLADLYGRKKAFMLGSFIQGVFSLGCGFAKDEITINVLRGIQGCGAAATIPACLGILAHAFPPSKTRSVAFATFAAGAPLGAAVGNTLGAVLTQLSDPRWRSVFFLSAGLNVLCMIGGAFSVDPDQPSMEVDKRVDYIGSFLITAGLTFIIFVLSDGSIAPQGWTTPYIIALLVLGVLLTITFLFWQHYLEKRHDSEHLPASRRFAPPIMRLSLWTRANGRFAVMQLIAFLNWCSFMSWNFWVQLYYQDYLRLSPVQTMLRLLPMFVTGLACNIIVALVVGRVNVIYLMLLGTSLTASANIFFSVADPSRSYWAYGFPSSILSVFGADFVFSAGTLFIAKVALPHEQSVAGALFQTMTQLGTSFGLAITTLLFNRVREMESAKLGVTVGDGFDSEGPPHAQLLAYRAAEWGGFGFGVVATLLCFFLRGVGIVGKGDNEVEDTQPDSSGSLKSSDSEEGKTVSPSSTPPTV